MKLHKHPLGYLFAPKWLTNFTIWIIEKSKGNDASAWWAMEGTPMPCGPPFIYQCIEGLTWAMGFGTFSTIDDYD